MSNLIRKARLIDLGTPAVYFFPELSAHDKYLYGNPTVSRKLAYWITYTNHYSYADPLGICRFRPNRVQASRLIAIYILFNKYSEDSIIILSILYYMSVTLRRLIRLSM